MIGREEWGRESYPVFDRQGPIIGARHQFVRTAGTAAPLHSTNECHMPVYSANLSENRLNWQDDKPWCECFSHQDDP